MATAVLRSHDVLDNRMHHDAFGVSPSKPRRRRQNKPATAAVSSSPPKMYAVLSQAAPKRAATSSPAPKPAGAWVATVSSSPPPKQAGVASPIPKVAAAGRRSPPARPARKQSSPAKENPKGRIMMEEVRILKRGEEPPAPAPAPSSSPVRVPAVAPPSAPVRVQAVAQAAPKDRRALPTTSRIGPQHPSVKPAKIAANAATYAGPAYSAAAPEPSSLPFPAFFLRQAETEATRGLRCLLRIGELS